MNTTCLFCKIIAKEIPSTIIAETDSLLVFKDINPQAPIHYLIIPKEHIVNIATTTHEQRQEYSSLFIEMAYHLSQKISGAQNFKLKINNGKSAGQEVMHMHWHFLAGY